jgi:hypothetical protein
MAHRWLLLIGLFVRLGAQAQTPAAVANDDLDARLPLSLGEPAHSRTDGCTVQWACVDEKLTGKCIDYHNDQWFSFRPARTGRYYLNIGGQQCRDVRGVQLVALTAGELCKPSTYSILSCTSLGTQDDIFVPLDAPQAGQEILLCVDGYLHDYCRFRLTVDTVARGVPVVSPPPFTPATAAGSARVELRWALPDSLLGATAFVVRRREAAQARATEAAYVPVERNSAGGLQRQYTLLDTLPGPGQYVYQIVTEGTSAPVLVWQQAFSFSRTAARASGARLALPLDRFRPGAALTLVVTDAFTGRVVRRAQLTRPKSGPGPALSTAELIRQGLQRIRVSITDGGNGRGEAIVEEFEATL